MKEGHAWVGRGSRTDGVARAVSAIYGSSMWGGPSRSRRAVWALQRGRELPARARLRFSDWERSWPACVRGQECRWCVDRAGCFTEGV